MHTSPARRTSGWVFRSFFASLLASLLVSAGVAGAQIGVVPALTYRADVTEVRISFSAVDQRNHAVSNLKAADFTVVDKDMIVHDFQSLTRSDWTDLEIAIVLDDSESLQSRLGEQIASAIEIGSLAAGPLGGNLSIFSFRGGAPALLCTGDCSASQVPEQLTKAHGIALTPLYDTLVAASDFLSQHGDAHALKVLIIFSDGGDTVSRYSMAEAIDAAVKSDVRIYSIDLTAAGPIHKASPHSGLTHAALTQAEPQTNPSKSNPRGGVINSDPEGSPVLRHLASATGGRYFSIGEGPSAVMETIAASFRATYTVTYRIPTHAAGFHLVQILPAHNSDLRFFGRSGYYYPDPAH